MAKKDFQDYLCRPFCSYFREGVREELACRGGTVAARLVESGTVDAAALRLLAGKGGGTVRDPLLESALCRRCPFCEDGCDFAARTPEAEPCGGYLALQRLVESGACPPAALSGTDDG